MKAIQKWIECDNNTWVKRVPGGMVMQVDEGGGTAVTFIPCQFEQFMGFLEASGVDLAPFEIVTPPPPKLIT